ncbi:MAG: hypothetical protein KDJ65_16135 [Anaerolineae bacterium]|nr:hypothetical protein [Anaerolineae bacterium]
MTINFQNFRMVRWAVIGLLVTISLSLLASHAAAQDPTPLPTPTPAPTWTPAPNATDTPVPNVPIQPTPIPATITPSGRLLDFRVDEDEIDSGDCVQFSWVVRGDIDRIEFDEMDDDKEAILVSEQDDREECPEEDTEYKLTVRWLDGSKTSDSIDIDVIDGSGDGTSSSGSSSNGSTGDTSGSTVGSFVIVTPIALKSLTPEAEEDTSGEDAFLQITEPGEAGQPVEKPAGALGSITMLPQTGKVLSDENYSAADHPAVTDESSFGYHVVGRWGFLIIMATLVVKLIIRPNTSARGSRH